MCLKHEFRRARRIEILQNFYRTCPGTSPQVSDGRLVSLSGRSQPSVPASHPPSHSPACSSGYPLSRHKTIIICTVCLSLSAADHTYNIVTPEKLTLPASTRVGLSSVTYVFLIFSSTPPKECPQLVADSPASGDVQLHPSEGYVHIQLCFPALDYRIVEIYLHRTKAAFQFHVLQIL